MYAESERNRLSSREYREFVEAEEKREQEERERPLREAERQLNETANQLAQVMRERIQSGRDNEFSPDAAVAKATMSTADASRFNTEQVRVFAANNPDFYPSEGNREILFSYLLRNGIQIANAETFQRAFQRLRDYGLLESAPAPEPIPEPEPEPTPELEPAPNGMQGFDLATGESRFYTDYEVNRMGAEQFRRAFRMTASDQRLARKSW